MKEAVEIAAAVRTGSITAVEVITSCLGDIEADAGSLGAITGILADRALKEACAVDTAILEGRDPGPLAGVPYGVKDLFDIAGRPTTAGSSIYENAAPAAQDAEAISRLRAAGAVMVATLNMDEFAYGFATINARHGTTRNPHDRDRLAGGSSGGSAAAVAAGLLSFSLGSDTNGSIRVPASLTGLYGLKPTHGYLPMAGVFPFAESFDDIGPFTTSLADMRCIWAVLAGEVDRPEVRDGAFRVARLGGRFRQNVDPDQIVAIDAIAPDAPMLEIADIARARSAAFIITAHEGGTLHSAALNRDALAFDPATRDRLIAGALVPPSLCQQAYAFRTRFQQTVLSTIGDYDVLLAPATPCCAPRIDDPHILIDGEQRPARADLGIHTQPISFAGLPSLSVPLRRPGRLPLGLQLIGRPGGEKTLFAYAASLEERGFIGVSPPLNAVQGECV